MSENKITKKISIITITAIITLILTVGVGLICYFSFRPKMTIVFYKAECVEEPVPTNEDEEYVCAYFRLNSDRKFTLSVDDFYIFNTYTYSFKFEKATRVEYNGQSTQTSFETNPDIPIQQIIKVYFNVPHSLVTKLTVITRYKETEMQIGEFAQIR